MKYFTTTHSSLEEVFGADKTYAVPAYQRPYSWRSIGKTDQNNQVNRMWDDLWGFFIDADSEKEYFFGSMVVIQKEARVFDVVDGQQRLTTLALLFGAMRCFMEKHCKEKELESFRNDSLSTLGKLLYNSSGVALTQTLKVKILRATGYDYNDVLARAVKCEPASTIKDPQYEEIADRYFENRDYLRDRLEATFLTDGVFTIANAEQFNKFFSFLYVRVAIVLITTTSFETAFLIFETLNNRGLPLSNVDLLRNFLLEELSEAKEPDVAAMWTTLEKDALTEEFMGRWVESWRGQQQRSSAFNDLIKVYDGDARFQGIPGKSKARKFYETIHRDLRYYSFIAEPLARVDNLAIRNKIRFLRVAGNERYSSNLMLALFRYLDYDGTESATALDFLRTYQRWLVHVLLSPSMRFSNSNIYTSIGLIRAGDIEGAKAVFSLGVDDAAKLSIYLGDEVRDNGTAKLLLAEYVWHEETQVHDVAIQELRWPEASLEHIIPQNPDAKSNWGKDFSKAFRNHFTYRLGNMTLITHKMNSSAKNYEFVKKREHYNKTILQLTKELAALDSLTPQYIEQRHARIVNGLCASLGLV